MALDLRDLFAIEQMKRTGPIDASSIEGENILYDQWAAECYKAADAFVKAREAGRKIPSDQIRGL